MDPATTASALPTTSRAWRHRLSVTLTLSAVIVAWEYWLQALVNPQIDWSPTGVALHMGVDLLLLTPVVLTALWLAARLARRLAFDEQEMSGGLGALGLTTALLLVVALPMTSSRDRLHEWIGTAYGVSLAEVQTTVVTTDLTVQEATQLCSFASVRDPSLARDGYQNFALSLGHRIRAGLEAALVQQATVLPLLLVALLWRRRRSFDKPLDALARGARQPLPLTAVTLTAAALLLLAPGGEKTHEVAYARNMDAPYNACADGGPVREYDVSAIDVTITLNRWGDHVNGAHMYALDANISSIRAFEQDLADDRELAEGLGVTRVSHGLRQDPIQPLVLRANLGDCLRVHFTNELTDGEPASMHVLGLPHTVSNAASAVGKNPSTFAAAGQTLTYELPIPLDPNAERAYYFHDHGAGRRRQNMGLFGAIVVEPRGSSYLDVETGEPLDTVTGSNWEAIILDPNLDDRADGKSFREFVIFYHEVGDEAFTDIRDRHNKKMPLVDEVAGIYRPAARALNYRSEPFRRRIEMDAEINGKKSKHGKSLGYASYPFGDPPTPMPRSYVGEGTKTRLLHGGSEIFHVHHLHGGADRWRRNPNADPNNDFWKGLTKVPDPKLTSIHLDSQSIGPGTSYNLEHECGAGGCQQGVGDFLYHCHIGHHYISGMWSFWRVFGTVQTEQTNLYGRPLAVVPELFQGADNPLLPTEPPEFAVSAGELLGLVVDGNRVLSDGPTTPSEINVEQFIADQLPPSGVPLDTGDATVWNWTTSGQGASLRVWGEPEDTTPFAGYTSTTPGERPEVLWNPRNGRYVWPLFRPHSAARPPFTARHSGAPWLGERMREGRLDGLCAVDGLAGVDLGGTSTNRFYPVSSITLPVQVTPDRQDPDGMIFVLNEHEEDIRAGNLAAEPLAIRSNVGDCVEVLFTNKIPDAPINKDFSKVNIHSHFVQFDTQASDGVITGFSYEQSVRPVDSEGRVLTTAAGPGDVVLDVNHTDRLREGIWLGVGLGEGTCGTTDQGQPLPCTEIRRITGLTSNTITLDQPLVNHHEASAAVGVEFVRYLWYPDVDFGTVFFHQHVEFKDWDHGLFGAHVVEPKGSTYHDPATGNEVRAGTLVDIRVDPSADGNPVAAGVDGSFREFMLFLHNNNTVEGRFRRGGGTINLLAEPWRLREGDAAYRFSSVTHGDPHTQIVRAYVGDPVVVRGMGLVERVGGIRFTGHRFQQERFSADSDTRDATFLGISERFDVSLEGGAGGPAGYPGDYLYYSTLGRDFESGAWGLLRVHDTAQGDLEPLPGHSPPSGEGFPQLGQTGRRPPALEDGPGGVCPEEAPRRDYQIEIRDTEIIYNDGTPSDHAGVAFRLGGEKGHSTRTPLVVRANAGDCLRLDVSNQRHARSSISLGEVLFDPQRSYGAAIGYNYDSTIHGRSERSYEYYADRELGIVIAMNLGDIDSVERGAFGAVVIEPEGATYHRPGSLESLPGGGSGVQADIVTNGLLSREFVALFSDEDRLIGQSAMPYPVSVEDFTGINYSNEPLRLRRMHRQPADVFRSDLWGDPRHVVTVPAGTPLVYRVAQPWGNQVHVPTLEGHRWLLEPGMAGSEQVFDDVLAPGQSLDLYFVGGAGGDVGAEGDFLFLDRRQPFLEAGLWNILRVTHGASGGGDAVTVLDLGVRTEAETTVLSVAGLNGIRPAGDTADSVVVFDGAATDNGCSGRLLGKARVDSGSGLWHFEATVAKAPARLCVLSSGGGKASEEVTP